MHLLHALAAALISAACTADIGDSESAEPDAGTAGASGAAASPGAAGEAGEAGAADDACAEKLPGGFVELADFGAVGDGVTDDSAALRAAAASAQSICVRKPSAFYRLTEGIQLEASLIGDGSMPAIRFEAPSGDWADSMLQVIGYGGTGLVISGLQLNGGWDGTESGEHSHAIYIGGSENVRVENMSIEDLRGDGVYVGGGGLTTAQSKNIGIFDNQISNPRRCDVAVIHVDGLKIANNQLSKTNSYVSAIDLEPNPNETDRVWNVVIDRNEFTSPSTEAILLYHHADWPEPSGGLGGNIEISNNSGDAQVGVKIVGTEWVNVTESGNSWW